jgi:excisionase family DNA binding protein
VTLTREPLADIEAVAERLGVGVRHVRRLVAEARIPYVKWGHLLRFDPEEIEKWLSEFHVAPLHATRRARNGDERWSEAVRAPGSARRRTG